MNKAELVEAVAARTGDRRAAAAVVEALLATVQRTVQAGERVTLSGFGVFERVDRAARTARNPSTGEAVRLAATSVPRFRPGQAFKDVIAGTRELPPEEGAPAVPAAPRRTTARAATTRAATAGAATAGPGTGAATTTAPASAGAAASATAASAGPATRRRPAPRGSAAPEVVTGTPPAGKAAAPARKGGQADAPAGRAEPKAGKKDKKAKKDDGKKGKKK